MDRFLRKYKYLPVTGSQSHDGNSETFVNTTRKCLTRLQVMLHHQVWQNTMKLLCFLLFWCWLPISPMC